MPRYSTDPNDPGYALGQRFPHRKVFLNGRLTEGAIVADEERRLLIMPGEKPPPGIFSREPIPVRVEWTGDVYVDPGQEVVPESSVPGQVFVTTPVSGGAINSAGRFVSGTALLNAWRIADPNCSNCHGSGLSPDKSMFCACAARKAVFGVGPGDSILTPKSRSGSAQKANGEGG